MREVIKMKIVLITLLIFFLCNLQLYSQWNLINPRPFEANINSSFFLNENIGWVACDYGEIYKTIDGGENWKLQPTGTTARLFSIYMVNQNLGFCVGWDGIILKTTNGGLSWVTKADGLAYFLRSVYFSDEMYGWTVGYQGKIFYSSNGGENWTAQASNVQSALIEVQFLNRNLGWAVGWNESYSGNKIIKTTNGGLNWQTVYSDSTNNFLYCLTFIDSLTGFAAGSSGKIIATTDGGNNWSLRYQTELSYNWFNSIFFSDALHGWAVGGFNNLVVRTTDGGNNWIELDTGINEPLWDSNNDVSFVSPTTGWVFNSGRVMYKTTNGGVSWFNQSKDFMREDLVSVQFLTELKGFALTYNTKILKTLDGGFTWSKTNYAVRDFSRIRFINDNTGFVAGTKNIYIPPYMYIPRGVLLKTTNEGVDWIEIFSSSDNTEFKDICFISESIGWLCGKIPGVALKTTDGGSNWTLQGTGMHTTPIINSIVFLSQDLGYAAGSRVYKTTNGGNDWFQLSFIPWTQISSIFFIDQNIGFAIGMEYNELYKTTDGGVSWFNIVVEPDLFFFEKIAFVNDSIGYILCNDRVFISTDQGMTWAKQKSPYHWGLRDISFINSNRGWIVGSKGFIMNTTNGGITFVEDNDKLPQPKEFTLEQNYPNPFNGQTNITYSILSTDKVTLKVYDVLGREVATLEDMVKESGRYTSQFLIPNSKFSSGVYFYQLKAGEFSASKKMMYLK